MPEGQLLEDDSYAVLELDIDGSYAHRVLRDHGYDTEDYGREIVVILDHLTQDAVDLLEEDLREVRTSLEPAEVYSWYSDEFRRSRRRASD